MKLAVLCLAGACCLAATMPPLPPTPHRTAKTVRGGGAADLLARPKLVVLPPAATTNTFVWKYPASVTASNLFWNIEYTEDLKNWSVLIQNASGPGEDVRRKSDPNRFYRLVGRGYPW